MSALENKHSVLEGLGQTAFPGLPIDEGDLVLWTMFYRHGNNPRCEKVFQGDPDMRVARDRAKKHCDAMGYNLNFIRPLISDLDLEEYKYQNGGREPDGHR